jgi:tRNA(His) guanylyltransferase
MSRIKKDSLGDRMKDSYENRARHFFPRRTYTLIRVDGKAFHTWTKGLEKPYDTDFMACMDTVAIRLCQHLSGAQLAFVQSDEVSVLLTDFACTDTQPWFDGNQSKIESVSASMATVAFNSEVIRRKQMYGFLRQEKPIKEKQPDAMFDSRAWTINDPVEVSNYFVWRQKDAERNSVTMLAGHYASHKKLHGLGISKRHDVIHEAGDNWNNHSPSFKRGRVIRKITKPGIAMGGTGWDVDEATPVFSKTPKFLKELIPSIEDSHAEKTETLTQKT